MPVQPQLRKATKKPQKAESEEVIELKKRIDALEADKGDQPRRPKKSGSKKRHEFTYKEKVKLSEDINEK